MSDAALAHLFRYNAWATRTLIDFIRGLSPAQHQATSAGVYGNLEQTMAHVVRAEDYYAFLLTAERPERRLAEGEPVDLDELLRHAERNASLFDRVARAPVDPDEPVAGRSGDPGARAVRVGIVLSQVLHHANEHRGQIRSILGANGIKPPDISPWAFGGGSEDW
ncbi:MAG TPA: DinB family protein [Candidatus Limnocylindria bacterium]|nr:DinB family protein [Candidatus Limnocylindria bacterium]